MRSEQYCEAGQYCVQQDVIGFADASEICSLQARISQKSGTIYSQSARSRSYFYGSVAAGIHRRQVLHIRRVLWSLVTPYGVDGAQRVAPVLESLKSRAALSPSPWTLSFSLYPSLILSFSTSISRLLERDSEALLCLGHRRSLHGVSRSVAVLPVSAVSPATSVANDADTRPFISTDSDA